MSIVTYENVDTPVFEIDFLRYLFANGAQGSFWGPLPYYSDAAGTVEADWGDPVGFIPDASGNGNGWTQVTSTARPILRNSPPRLEFDGTDDAVTTTLPAISGGTIVLAGTNGIWIDEIDFAGGEFSVGPDTYTGGPTGLMSILGDILARGCFVIDRALTPEEIAKVEGYYKARGSAGLIELGAEQKQDYVISGSAGRAEYVSDGDYFHLTREGSSFGIVEFPADLAPARNLVRMEWLSGDSIGVRDGDNVTGLSLSASSPALYAVTPPLAVGPLTVRHGGTPAESTLRVNSIRRLIMPGDTL